MLTVSAVHSTVEATPSVCNSSTVSTQSNVEFLDQVLVCCKVVTPGKSLEEI